jgi:hypothetical protein
MNENRIKTSVNTGEVSLPPAQRAVWSVKPHAQWRGGSEKQGFDGEKGLDKPRGGGENRGNGE